MKSTFTPLTVRWTIEQTFPSWKFSNAILHQEPAEMLSLPLSPVTLPSLYSASTCRTLQLCPAKQRCLQHLIRGGVRLICFIWSQAWAGFRAEVGAPFCFPTACLTFLLAPIRLLYVSEGQFPSTCHFFFSFFLNWNIKVLHRIWCFSLSFCIIGT